MIDTVRLKYFDLGNGRASLEQVCSYKEIVDNDGVIHYEGNLKGLRIKDWSTFLQVEGSLPRYLEGNNIVTLNLDKIKEAISSISSELAVPIEEAFVTRLDIAATFRMDYPVKYYLDLLEGCAKHKTGAYSSETKFFYNGLRKLSFYDKAKEQRKRNKAAIEQITGDKCDQPHLLRFEVQLKRRPHKQLGLSELRAKQLYDPGVYERYLNFYKRMYRAIHKTPKLLDFEARPFVLPSDLRDSLLCSGLEQLGKEDILSLIERKYQTNDINKPNYYRMRKMIHESHNRFSESSKYLEELNEKIENVENYALRIL